jgi:hypothetical protein
MSYQPISEKALPDEIQHSQETDTHAPRDSQRIVALHVNKYSFLFYIMHDQFHEIQPIKKIMHSYTII